MTDLQARLFENRDEKYAEFQAKLAPGIPLESCIGVRVPKLRQIAAEFKKTPESEIFLNTLPHKYYDENLLHSILLQGQNKDFEKCLKMVNSFLPFIDNWAVCDTLRPKIFEKHKNEVLPEINKWINSSHTYTCRFGIDMLMTYFLDEDFKPEYLKIPAAIKSDEYYVKMMIAWYYATALSKQWKETIPYIEKGLLSPWVHNKTIQKAIESFRITDEQKTYLKTLRK